MTPISPHPASATITQLGDQVDRALITVGSPAMWPATRRLVAVGAWCLNSATDASVISKDITVLPYHWDDRIKLRQDYRTICELYEEALDYTRAFLNEAHGTQHSERYWRIVVGWWIFSFAQVFFDRWETIRHAADAIGPITLYRLPYHSSQRALAHFGVYQEAVEGILWNECLFADIAEHFPAITVVSLFGAENALADQAGAQRQSGDFSAKATKTRTTYLGDVIDRLSRTRISSRNSIAFHMDYLPPWKLLALQLKLHQWPTYTRRIWPPEVAPNPRVRETWPRQATGDALRDALHTAVGRHLPTCYLEGYRAAETAAEELGFPTSPEVIVSANAYFSDDLWKIWASSRVQSGSRLIAMQHGGHYGVGLDSPFEDHELAISDKFLTWGWSSDDSPKAIPSPAQKLLALKRRRKAPSRTCVLISYSTPILPPYSYSAVLGPQMIASLDHQFAFVEQLGDTVRRDFAVRLYPHEHGWNLRQRWTDRIPNVKLISGQIPMAEVAKNAALLVSTYNATAYLESFVQDIPTILLWDSAYWELRQEAVPYFKDLADANIFFVDPLECARHVETIWPDIGRWWDSEEVQAAVLHFCDRYAYVGSDPVNQIAEILRSA